MSYIVMSDGSSYECDLSAKEFVERAVGVDWVITSDGDYVHASQISRIVEKPKTDTNDDFGALFESMFHRTKGDA